MMGLHGLERLWGAVCFFKRIGRELHFEIDRLSFGRRRPNNCLESPPPSAFIHTGLTRARGSMFTHFTPADLVAILNIPRLQTLPNSFKILREYRLSVVALVFSR